jgi:hypothetical protein
VIWFLANFHIGVLKLVAITLEGVLFLNALVLFFHLKKSGKEFTNI